MTVRRAMPTAHRQRGQALIGVVLATALIALLLVGYVRFAQARREDHLTNEAGAQLAQYAVGIRGFIAHVQGGSQSLPSNPYTVNGVKWLKPAACGGLSDNPVEGYVPCTFDAGALGSRYKTTVIQTPATNTIEARTSFFVPHYGGDNKSLGTLASKVANAAMSQQTLPANGTFITALANVPLTAAGPVGVAAINPADRGRVLLIAANNPSNDVWLRTDGTNQMLADLNMGTHSITDAQDGTFAGDVRVKGVAQVDQGLTVTSGTADLRGGAIAPDVKINSVGKMASQAFYDARVLTGAVAYTVPKPDCSQANSGSSQPAIYASLQGTGTPMAANGDALYEAHVNVASTGNSWTVTPVEHAAKFTLTGASDGTSLTVDLKKDITAANPTDQRIVVLTKCK